MRQTIGRRGTIWDAQRPSRDSLLPKSIPPSELRRVVIPERLRPDKWSCCQCGQTHKVRRSSAVCCGPPPNTNSAVVTKPYPSDDDSGHPHQRCDECRHFSSSGEYLAHPGVYGPHKWDCHTCKSRNGSVLGILEGTEGGLLGGLSGCCDLPRIGKVRDHMGDVLIEGREMGLPRRLMDSLGALRGWQEVLYAHGAWVLLDPETLYEVAEGVDGDERRGREREWERERERERERVEREREMEMEREEKARTEEAAGSGGLSDDFELDLGPFSDDEDAVY